MYGLSAWAAAGRYPSVSALAGRSTVTRGVDRAESIASTPSVARDVDAGAEGHALGAPGALDVAERSARVGEHDVRGDLSRHDAVDAGRALHGVDLAHVAGEPERLVEVVDHLVEHDAAAGGLVEEPRAGARRLAAAHEPQHGRRADASRIHLFLDPGVLGEEPHDVRRKTCTPAFSAAATISRAASDVAASGFSHTTCFPAAIAASARSRWDRLGGDDVDDVDGRQQVIEIDGDVEPVGVGELRSAPSCE